MRPVGRRAFRRRVIPLAAAALHFGCAAADDKVRTNDSDGAIGNVGASDAAPTHDPGDGGAVTDSTLAATDSQAPSTEAAVNGEDTGMGGPKTDAGADLTGDGAPTPIGDSAVIDDAARATDSASVATQVKPRVVAMTDIGFDPDDQESLVRYLVYSNEFDTEALIAITSLYLKSNPREDLIRQEVAAYGLARPNLVRHAEGFPDGASLLAVTKTGQPGYGMAAVGPGQSSAGSQQLITAIDKADPRPVWVTIWGGANTLAQALHDVSASRTASDVARFVSKIRVYSISDQDDAGAWLRKMYPALFYVVSPSSQSPADYPRATWSGISGDRWYKNGPLFKFDMVDNPWLQANIIMNHGPLGAIYPIFKWIMEGDTPSYIGLVDNGLGWSVSPSYGGWGGRYALLQPAGEARPLWTNDNLTTRDTVAVDDGGTATSDQASIWRWREAFQDDFAARMNWCVADQFANANHNPLAVLNGDKTTQVLAIPAKSGSVVALAAAGTTDPDGDAVQVTWWIYSEAGTLGARATLGSKTGLTTQVRLPVVQSPGTVHVIMQAEDSGTPRLFSYRRAVLEVAP